MTGSALRVVPVDEPHIPGVMAYVAAAQTEPSRHVTYVGVEPDTLSEEFARAEAWMDRLLVALNGDEIEGVLLADIDRDMRRVWWLGPWADREEVAVALLSAARERFGALFDEEELAPDGRNEMLRSAAGRLGFHEETAAAVLSKFDVEADGGTSTQPLTVDRAEAVAELHDSIFVGTHTPGSKLIAAEDTRIRTAQVAGAMVGYIAYEVQVDGTGYIDYLGVRPDVRRRGLGRALVDDACRDLASAGVRAVHLTVRVDASGAIDLYRSLGFIQERVIVPYRHGFSLG